jgi:YD repeat-containing protein
MRASASVLSVSSLILVFALFVRAGQESKQKPTGPAGFTSTQTYDLGGRFVSATDSRGRTTHQERTAENAIDSSGEITGQPPTISMSATAAPITIHVPADQPTIQQAINVAVNGDTVLVSPGTYKENIDFHGKAIVVISQNGPATTTIDGGNLNTVVTFDSSEGLTSQLRGFTIRNGSASFGAGITMLGASPTIIANYFVSNTEGGGGFGAAIGGNGSSPDIERNVFVNNSCDVQFLSGVVSFVNGSSPIVANNIFHDNSCRAINMTLPVGNLPSVINNTIFRNSVGIRVDARIATAQQVYENNLLIANQVGLEVDFLNPGNDPTWKNNDVFNNATNYMGIGDLTGTAGNISVDPHVLSTNNLHQQFGSPVIDAGDSSAPGLPSKDFDGFPRVQGKAVDMGAYEFFPTSISSQPSSVTFPTQLIGTTSAAQPVAVKNTGAMPLFLAISVTGDFLQSSNCPARLAPSASCTANVSFKPTAVGTRSGKLLFADNASASPQNVLLTGTGQGFPIVSLSATSLAFGIQALGSTSASKNVILKNTGTTALSITSIGPSGDFTIPANMCGSSLSPQTSCTISVAFQPTAVGTRIGNITINDNATGSPHTVSLTGTATAVTLSPSALNFSPQVVGTTSSGRTVTVTNHSTATLNFTGITIAGTNAGDFVIASKTCGSSLAGNTTCNVTMKFRPSMIGPESAKLTFFDDGGASPQIVPMAGAGTVVTLSRSTITFPPQPLGTTSAPQSVTLTNHGATTLHINSVSVVGTNAGDFLISFDSCPPDLVANSGCTVSVEFQPTAIGTRTASLAFSDNGGASPQLVKLTGTGQ